MDLGARRDPEGRPGMAGMAWSRAARRAPSGPSRGFVMTDEEIKTDAVEDPESPAAMIGDMKRLLDEQRAEIEKLRQERADLMRELMRTTPTAAPPKEPERTDYDAFKAKVLKKAYDIVEARM